MGIKKVHRKFFQLECDNGKTGNKNTCGSFELDRKFRDVVPEPDCQEKEAQENIMADMAEFLNFVFQVFQVAEISQKEEFKPPERQTLKCARCGVVKLTNEKNWKDCGEGWHLCPGCEKDVFREPEKMCGNCGLQYGGHYCPIAIDCDDNYSSWTPKGPKSANVVVKVFDIWTCGPKYKMDFSWGTLSNYQMTYYPKNSHWMSFSFGNEITTTLDAAALDSGVLELEV